MEVIVGTAGHIDHGKTALVKALTGIDADRLPEEKRRGITVDLGFAEMSVGDMHFGFVDVPGHERFVKNMLAGASGIDLVMLIIAADEGVMPQTREHFDICRLLGIKAGIIVLTKVDLVNSETLDLAKMDAAELAGNSFLGGAPMVSVSSLTGDGIENLKMAIVQIGSSLPARNDQLTTRLPIDRSFSMKGFGAVVTGTLASGEITEGREMELLPIEKKVRVRGIQSHGKVVKTVRSGRRVAVNLSGIDHSKIERGMVLVVPDILQTTQIIDAEIEVLASAVKPLRSRQRVRVHLGTIEALARIQVLNNTGEIAPGDRDLVQIRLETPVVTVSGEKFVIRSYSPPSTIAGGEVIDPLAAKHRRKDIPDVREFLNQLKAASDSNAAKIGVLVKSAGQTGLDTASLQARTALKFSILKKAIDDNLANGAIIDASGRYIDKREFDVLLNSAETALTDFHKREPLAKGMLRERLREEVFAYLANEIFHCVLKKLTSSQTAISDNETIRLVSHKAQFLPEEEVFRRAIFDRYETAGLEVPKLEDALSDAAQGTRFSVQDARKYFQMFLDVGEIVKVTGEFYFERMAIDALTKMLRQYADRSSGRTIDVAQFKELAGVSRKYAIPLLEYFDRERITRRVGDKRVIL
ncbi:MAG: selenocysteine-specific translation elongation factor [Pyrinomonadaceae bacterium]